MFIRVTFNPEIKDDIESGIQCCPRCGQISHFHLKRLCKCVSLFGGIPIARPTLKYLMVCDNCDVCLELKKDAYKNLKKNRLQKLKNFDFDADVARQDFAPAKLQMGKKWALLIFTIFIALCGISLFFEMTAFFSASGNAQAVDWVLSFVFTLLSLLPLLFFIPNFREARLKQKAYRHFNQ